MAIKRVVEVGIKGWKENAYNDHMAAKTRNITQNTFMNFSDQHNCFVGLEGTRDRAQIHPARPL